MPAIDPMVDLSYDRDEGGSWRIRAKITHVTEKKNDFEKRSNYDKLNPIINKSNPVA